VGDQAMLLTEDRVVCHYSAHRQAALR
jgi:hypothetical protein